MNSKIDKPSKLPALTGLRFFAALHVLFFHNLSTFSDVTPIFYNVIKHGYIGVSLFFVLSGFILAYNYASLTKTIGKKTFLINRFTRIYPIYFSSIVIALPLFSYFLIQTLPFILAVGKITIVSSLSVFLMQSWTPWTIGQLNGPAWSLSVEAFLYFIFPFVVAKIVRLKVRKILIIVIICWIILSLITMVYVLAQPDKINYKLIEFPLLDWMGSSYPIWRTFVTSFPLFHLPQFVIGICTGVIFSRHSIRSSKDFNQKSFLKFSIIEILLSSFLLLILELDFVTPELLNNGILSPVYGLLFFILAYGQGIISKGLSLPILLLLGEASYAMYLFQNPVRSWVEIALNKLFNRGFGVPNFILYFIILIICSLWISQADLWFQKFVKSRRIQSK